MSNRHGLSAHEPPPTPNAEPACWDLVLRDIAERDAYGAQKYGVRMQPFNGRDYAVASYPEALDLVVYLRGLIHERAETLTLSRAEVDLLVRSVTLPLLPDALRDRLAAFLRDGNRRAGEGA